MLPLLDARSNYRTSIWGIQQFPLSPIPHLSNRTRNRCTENVFRSIGRAQLARAKPLFLLIVCQFFGYNFFSLIPSSVRTNEPGLRSPFPFSPTFLLRKRRFSVSLGLFFLSISVCPIRCSPAMMILGVPEKKASRQQRPD